MNLVPSGVPVSIEVTYQDPGLNVGLLLFDDSGVAPVQVGSMISMLNWIGSSYRAKLSALTAGTSYLIHKAVYTDNTFSTIDTTYSQSSESFYAHNFNGSSSSSSNGLVVKLTEAKLNVSLSSSELVSKLNNTELKSLLSSDSLTVIFPCN